MGINTYEVMYIQARDNYPYNVDECIEKLQYVIAADDEHAGAHCLMGQIYEEQLEDYVHAGFTNLNGVKHEYFTRMFYWERTLWETALALDKNMDRTHPNYPKRFTLYKEIFIGHTPVTRIGQTIPVNMANVWNIDTGAAFKGPLTIMDADTKEYWQSDPVHTLYPEENGRN